MKLKGIVLAGGTGSRLYPLTKALNKHVLPVYDKPMIYYPIQSLVDSGITEIVLVTGGNHIGQFIDLLGDGSDLGCNLCYTVQSQPGGIADALSMVEAFVDNNPMVVVLGDNIFMDDIPQFVEIFKRKLKSKWINNGKPHCHLLCKQVGNQEATNYGILTVGKKSSDTIIYEKPVFPLSYPDGEKFNAVTGLYMYTPDVFERIKTLSPSERNELEVTDLNNTYANEGNLTYSILFDDWFDCGVDIDHMLHVASKIKNTREKQ